MTSAASVIDPHDKMRARDVNKVARGEQAPRPSHENPTVSKAPPPSSTNTKVDETEKGPADEKFPFSDQTLRCFTTYLEYLKCLREKGKDTQECEKFAKDYQSVCLSEWIEKWNEVVENDKQL